MTGSEIGIIESLLKNEKREVQKKVIQNIENFKNFANIDVIQTNLNYIVWNELQKIKEGTKDEN